MKKSDKDKLLSLEWKISAIESPILSDERAKQILDEVEDLLTEARNLIKNAVREL